MRALALVMAACLAGCSVATHDYKHRYWVKKDDVEALPAANVHAAPGYISYPLLFSRKEAFASVADNCAQYPIDIRVTSDRKPALNPLVALPWIMISGSSVFIIPYKGEFDVTTEFTVAANGKDLRTFRYTDKKTTWLSFFAFATLGQKTDEYYVEELMADQFVNSFILDLYKDAELLAQLRAASAPAAPPETATPEPAAPAPAPG